MAGKPELETYIQIDQASGSCSDPQGQKISVGPITLTIWRGELFSILGPVACGKGAILRLIAGLDLPASGEVRLAGQRINGPPRDMGIVFRDPLLLPWRTVLGNVLVQGELRKLNLERSLFRARRLFGTLGLSSHERSYPSSLPRGFAARVALCRALLHNPSLLIMDDPFSALESLSREQMSLDLQRLLTGSGITVVLATSNIREAVQLSDRVAVMSPAGSLLRILDVDLPRPRRLDKTTSPRIGQYANDIRMILHAEGVLS